MKFTSLLILGSVLLVCRLSLAVGLDGVFEGAMELTKANGEKFSVPLAIALSPTGEQAPRPVGSGGTETQVIDGAFVIDEEGGPYSFTKVSYRVEENFLDLRYDRLDVGSSSERSAAFRLVGELDPKGNYKGRVISGVRGPIGTFALAPTELKTLPVTNKYVGTWRGQTTIGTGGDFAITISESPIVTVNPINLEFEYTPGRLASVSYLGTGYDISEVVFDYLRRRVYLIQRRGQAGGQSLVFQAEYDPKSQKIWGVASGGSTGRTGTFTLEKDPEGN